jgi:TolB-like protein
MSPKKIASLIAVVALAGAVQAQSLQKAVGSAVDELARKAAAGQVSRLGVAILPIEDSSPLAKKHEIGAAVKSLIDLALSDSLVFKLIDRANLEAALSEIELSLSAGGEGDRVKAGAIEDAEYLLAGTVTEEGDRFRVALRLISASTTETAAVAETSLPVADLAYYGDQVTFQYVTANGIGLSFGSTPVEPLVLGLSPTADLGGSDGKSAAAGIGALEYRVSRSFKLSIQPTYLQRNIYFDGSTGLASRASTNMPGIGGIPGTTIFEYIDPRTGVAAEKTWSDILLSFSDNYRISQQIIAVDLVPSYVLNLGRKLDVSIGAGPSLGSIAYTQTYDALPTRISGDTGPGVTSERKDIRRSIFGAGGAAVLQVEWFFLPRMALHAGLHAQYLYPLFSTNRDGMSSLNDGEEYYTKDDRSRLNFGLNPFMLPDGTPWSDTLFSALHANAYLGVAVYF